MSDEQVIATPLLRLLRDVGEANNVKLWHEWNDSQTFDVICRSYQNGNPWYYAVRFDRACLRCSSEWWKPWLARIVSITSLADWDPPLVTATTPPPAEQTPPPAPGSE